MSGASDSPRLRLVHVTTIPMSLTFLRGQVGYMRARGIRIEAVSSPDPDLWAFGEREGVPVHAVEMPRRITPAHDIRAIARLYRVLRRVRPHIVHSHTPKGGLLGMIAAALARVPVRIYHMRGLPLVTSTGVRRFLLRLSERVSCRLAHLVLCVSHSLRETAVEEGLCEPEKILVAAGGSGNGVDATGRFDPAKQGAGARAEARAQLGIPPDAIVLGYVGRIVRDKGVVELTGAWREIRAEYPHAHLLMVGPFEPQDPVPKGVEATLREDPRVHLAGMEWNTPPLYAAMDMVVLPTYREGFPNVPLEGAAMELPVIATSVPGCIDAVHDGETGILVPPRNPVALAAAVRRYIEQPELRRRHGAAGRARVLREFRQEAIWEAIHEQYVRLLQARGQAVPRAVEAGA